MVFWASVTLAGAGRANLDLIKVFGSRLWLSFWWEIPLENDGNAICETLDFKIFSAGGVGWGGGPTIFYQQPQLTNH